MNEIKPNEIDKILKENQFKYLELKGADGKKYGGYNQNPATLKKKVESIKQFCSNLPDGIYYINFKISPQGDIFTYCYNKGNFLNDHRPNNMQMISAQVPQVSQIEKLQTIDEWRKQEAKINELQNELNFLKLESKFTSQLAETKIPVPENPILGFFTNSLPLFMPIVEKYFDLEQQKINNSKNIPPQILPPKKSYLQTFRPVPEMNDRNFEIYLNYLMKLPDDQLEKELIYLKANNPDILNYINNNFFENESNENPI